jgi:hypothetical protein
MPTLPSGLPDQIAESEELARFLTQSSHFNSQVAKPAAFLPSKTDRETSISRHGRAPDDALWELGKVAAGTRPLYGAAIFKAEIARKAGLEVKADEPPDRHAVLRGWPWIENDPDLQRAKQKEIAMVLSSIAVVLLHG